MSGGCTPVKRRRGESPPSEERSARRGRITERGVERGSHGEGAGEAEDAGGDVAAARVLGTLDEDQEAEGDAEKEAESSTRSRRRRGVPSRATRTNRVHMSG